MLVPYVLPADVQDLGHGIRLSSHGRIQSKKFACYIDANGTLRFGYIFRNGSNYRLVSWEDEQRINRAVSTGAPIIEFADVVTPYPFASPNFSAEDFNPPWLGADVQVSLRTALMAWHQREFDSLFHQMGRLSIHS